jgi:hypothetical protein
MPHYTQALFEEEEEEAAAPPPTKLTALDVNQVVCGDRVIGPDGRWCTVVEIMPVGDGTVLGLHSVAAPSGYVWQSFTGQVPVRR